MYPSPHIYEHVEAEVVFPSVQLHPVAFPVQVGLQPSPFAAVPSSHVSGEITLESPQTGVQVSFKG